MARTRTWLDYFFGPWVLRLLGVDYPERPTLELIAGANVTITAADDSTGEATQVTIASTGGGGGGGAPTGAAGGDLGATYPDPIVEAVKQTVIGTAGGGSAGAPLRMTGAATADWGALDLSNGNARTGTLPRTNQQDQNMVGDVTGTTGANTVAKINGTVVTTAGGGAAGLPLRMTGTSTSDWGALDLSNGATTTGTLSAGKQAAQTMAGDVTGTTAASVVTKINGGSVPAAGALTVGNILYVSAAGAYSTGALNLAGGANYVTGVLPLLNHASPTGTGLAKVSGGAWTGAASLLLDADVNAAAAIAGTKISPNFGAQNLVTTGVLSLGTSPGSLGLLRLPTSNTQAIAAGAQTLLGNSSSEGFLFTDSAFANQCTNGRIYASSALFLGIGSTTAVQFSGGSVFFAGAIGGTSSVPFHWQITSLTFSGTDITLSGTQIGTPLLLCSGGIGNIIAPNTTGSFYIVDNYAGTATRTIKKSGGTGCAVGSASCATVYHNGTDYVIVSSHP